MRGVLLHVPVHFRITEAAIPIDFNHSQKNSLLSVTRSKKNGIICMYFISSTVGFSF